MAETASPPARPRLPPRPQVQKPPALERTFVTPEGVDLKLQLAEFSQRGAAFMLDLFIMLALLVSMTFLLLLAAYAFRGSAKDVLVILWLLGFFFIRNLYFIVFESQARAATFGKRAMGLRVVARDGSPLTIDAVIARNMLREVEVYLPLSFLIYQLKQGTMDAWVATFGLIWTGVLVLFPLFNRDRLRAGDLIAGTWVIRTPKRTLRLDLASSESKPLEPYPFTDAQLSAYGIYELHALEGVLRQQDKTALKTVADSIRKKISWPAGNDDVEFLNAYYTKLRARLERGLLFGKRRTDKNDKA